jgi:geranylgeranyl pyrophosphate synthase
MTQNRWITKVPQAKFYSRVVGRHLDNLVQENLLPQVFNEAVGELISAGGKLIRPILTLCASETTGKRFNSLALHSAVALEMLHVSSLILDDIIDESPRRRGMKSLHLKYGNDVAIVAAVMLLASSQRNLTAVKRLRAIHDEALNRVLLGQAIETRGQVQSEKQYLRMIELKTASLFVAAVRMGAAANRLPRGVTESLAEYARNLGMAFQIRDDICDLATALRASRKAELRPRKPTLLRIKLLGAGGGTRSEMAGTKSPQRRNLAPLRKADRLANEFCQRAIAALANLRESPAKMCLIDLARGVARS